MKKIFSFLTISSIFLVTGFSACQQKPIQSTVEQSETQNEKVLYVTLKVLKTGNGLTSELVNQDIREAYDTPRGLKNSETGDTFRCEIFSKSGSILYTSEKKFEFEQSSTNETSIAFPKFRISLPSEYDSFTISAKISDGVWQEMQTSSLSSNVKK